MTLLDLHHPQPPQSCLKTMALAGEQMPASYPRTVVYQWRQAAAVPAVHAPAQAEVLVAARVPAEAVVASQPAP